jgi:hypothetical protein
MGVVIVVVAHVMIGVLMENVAMLIVAPVIQV